MTNFKLTIKELINAIHLNEEDIIDFFIKKGFDFNKEDENGNSALYVCSKFNISKNIISKVLDQNIDINKILDKDRNDTALTISAYRKDDNLFDLLIQKKYLNLNHTNHLDQTALWLAMHKGNLDKAFKLLNLGADPNLVDIPNKISPLIKAVHHNNIDLIKLFLNKGADVNKINTNGYNALHYVNHLDGFNSQVFDLLLNKNINVENYLQNQNQVNDILAKQINDYLSKFKNLRKLNLI